MLTKFVNYNIVNMKIATIIKDARKAMGWSFRKLSAETSIDAAILNKFEKGERTPGKTQILKLIDILRLDRKEALSIWLADKIYNLIEDEDYILESLQVAENKINYELYKASRNKLQLPVNLQNILDECNHLKSQWDAFKPLSTVQVRKMEEHFQLNYTYESNRIEGNTLTLQETHLVVNEGLTIGGKSMREHLEAINHSEAIIFITELIRDKTEFTERILKQIHYLILKGIDRGNAGVYRSVGVRISGSSHVPPEPFLLSSLMEEVFEYYTVNKKKTHPIILAAEMHERIVRIHPFIDGNGRTTRLVMNLILMQNGFPIANIKGDLQNRARYYQSLESAPMNEKSDFFLLIADTVKQALNEHIDLSK